MNIKIIGFFSVLTAVLVFVIVCLFYSNKSLKAEKNALCLDVERYKQSLFEMEKQNEILNEAKKENEQFKQELSDDRSDNLDVSPSTYILNRMHAD